MGVIVGVVVLVGVALGLGETVHVGDGVYVGVTVLVTVSLGEMVHVAVDCKRAAVLHPGNKVTANNNQMISLNKVLICNGVQRCNVKKGIVIADFSL